MNHKLIKTLSLLCIVELMQFGVSSSAWAEAPSSSSVDTLLEQAQYWHQKQKDSLAIDSLKKVLMIDANNPEALFLMATLARQQGKEQEASVWIKRLEKSHPHSAQLKDLQETAKLEKLPTKLINLARSQAENGNIKASIKTWDRVFPDGNIPTNFASEYYLTMAGESSLYAKAVKGLHDKAETHPNNAAIGESYAKVLTYRPYTRRKGIRILEHYAPKSSSADKALRKALLWLKPTSADEQRYLRWSKRHPTDNAVMAHYNNSQEGRDVEVAFSRLNQGQAEKAKRRFEQVLKHHPNNADALAGLGYVYLHLEDYDQAANYLSRSAKQGGKNAQKRQRNAHEARFFSSLAKAKAALKRHDTLTALSLSKPLVKEPGKNGLTAKLFYANVLRQQGQYSEAETVLRSILSVEPTNTDATKALYYVLSEQNKTRDAEAVLRALPRDFQQKIKASNSYLNIRNLAQQAKKFGNNETAIVILKNGLERLPHNPWLRLDLARLYAQENQLKQARQIIRPLEENTDNPDGLFAAALFAEGQKQWQIVSDLLSRIRPGQRSNDAQQLYKTAQFNLKLNVARSFLAQGNQTRARMALVKLKDEVKGHPRWAGQLAALFLDSGDRPDALQVVQSVIAEDINGNATEYTDLVAVLFKLGLQEEAQGLLNNPSLVAQSTPEQVTQLRNVYVINQADTLRQQGNYAPAYDILMGALQKQPKNTALMLAMARLYHDGKMNDKAMTVYQYVLQQDQDTPQQDARLGAINIYLAQDDPKAARQLFEQLNDKSSPPKLMLLARLYEKEGKHQLALAALRRARGKLLGYKSNSDSNSPMVGGLLIADNPFLSGYESHASTSPASVYGEAMPWQVKGTAQTTKSNLVARTDLPKATENQKTLADVNALIGRLRHKTANWVQGGIEVRSRDGESGLSKLTETRVPLQWSTVPYGDARLSVNVDAVVLDAGSSSGDANRRLGTGALIQGQVAQQIPKEDRSTLPDVDSQGAQREHGIELKAALSSEHYDLDIGTTPLGLDKSTVVGGVTLRGKVTDNTELSITGERRSVKDSLLSYVGMTDQYSGKFWGLVTKNGVNLRMNYDNGDLGYYANVGAASYLGHNVEDNQSIEFGTGMYFRLLNNDVQQLKVGVALQFKDFDKNLSYHSLGHGGYFSPQNYVSLMLPIDYQREYEKLTMSVGGAVGYQASSEDAAPYFPGQSAMQSQLEGYVANQQAKEAFYDGKSKSGMGYNFHAAIGYQIQQNLELKVRLGYDTFQDYNETQANISLRRSFGAQ